MKRSIEQDGKQFVHTSLLKASLSSLITKFGDFIAETP